MEERKHKEIDVLALAKRVLQERRTLTKFVVTSAIIGLIVALNTPREFTAQTVLAPEMSAGGLGLSSNIADMAATFGINLDKKSSVDAIYPELYPDIFASTDFIRQLFDVTVRTKEDDTPRTFIHHITKETKVPFWSWPQIWLSELLKKADSTGGNGVKDAYKISRTDADICDGISKSILCLVDKKTSEIIISYTDQDPLVATIIVDTLQRRLQNYITDYRTKKARIDYEYYKTLSAQMLSDYEQSRNKYVAYADSHTDVQMQSFNTKMEEMENDMQQKYDSYKSMLASMRQAKAKIQANTPAFTIIQSPMMPHKPTSRPKIVTLFMFIFLGVLADAAWVLYLRQHVKH